MLARVSQSGCGDKCRAEVSPGAAAEVPAVDPTPAPSCEGNNTLRTNGMGKQNVLQNKAILAFSLPVQWDYISLEHSILKSSII